MAGLLTHKIKITLREEDHRYFDQYGQEYISQSKFVGMFKNEFKTNERSLASAAKNLREKGEVYTQADVLKEQERLKKHWKHLGEDSSDHGNSIHKPLEYYGKGLISKIHPTFIPLCEDIYKDHLQKYKWFNEQIFFLEDFKIAGSADLPVARTNSLKTTLDIDDFKTNKRKGIEFFSKYGNHMKGPLSHLEDCNYNHYALQISLYAYMALTTFGVKPGSLAIRYIKAEIVNEKLLDYEITRYPVPFMYHEIEAMLDYYAAMQEQSEHQIFEP